MSSKMSHKSLLREFSKVMGREFRFVDEILCLDKEQKTIKTVFLYNPRDSSKSYLSAHLITELIFPGVLLLEGMAQTCGLLAMALNPELNAFYSRGYDRVRFRKKVLPQSLVIFEAKLLEDCRGLWKFCVAAIDAEKNEFASATYFLFAGER